MNVSGTLVKGWCPGALRPMAAGDGLILRVKPRLGKISLAQFKLLADVSSRFGDGNLHLTSRANIQIRGLREEDHPAAVHALNEAGLIDTDPRAEAVRNVLATPPVSLRAFGTMQAADLAREIERSLCENQLLHALPGKFGIAVQAGGRIDRSYVSDVTFLVTNAGCILMFLDGALGEAAVVTGIDQATRALSRVSAAFIGMQDCTSSIRRMRDAVAHSGAGAVFKAAELNPTAHGLEFFKGTPPAGLLDFGGGASLFGIGFTFGEMKQDALAGLLDFMQWEGVHEAALSPHRVLVFPLHEGRAGSFAMLADRIGAIADPGDVRLRVHACVGAPACARGTTPVQRDAEAVIHALQNIGEISGSVHISGCEKRCAYAHEASITAIAKAGRYEISGRGNTVLKTGISSSDLPRVAAGLARKA